MDTASRTIGAASSAGGKRCDHKLPSQVAAVAKEGHVLSVEGTVLRGEVASCCLPPRAPPARQRSTEHRSTDLSRSALLQSPHAGPEMCAWLSDPALSSVRDQRRECVLGSRLESSPPGSHPPAPTAVPGRRGAQFWSTNLAKL